MDGGCDARGQKRNVGACRSSNGGGFGGCRVADRVVVVVVCSIEQCERERVGVGVSL